MRTTITYFGNLENSRKGTIRSLVGMVFLAICFTILYSSFYSLVYKASLTRMVGKNFRFFSIARIIYISLILLMLSIAIAVQIPNSTTDSFTYGLLSGFTIFSVANLTLLYFARGYSWFSALFDTLAGSLIMGVVAVIVYQLAMWMKWY